MGLFDSIQNAIGSASDLAGGSLGDVVGGVTDNPVVQDLQDQATSLTEGGTEIATNATEQGQTVVDDISQHLGL